MRKKLTYHKANATVAKLKKLSVRKNWRTISLALVVVLVGGGGAIVWRQTSIRRNRPDIHNTAIISDDALLKRYIKAYGPVQAITLIKSIPGADCHQRSHKIGRLNYEVVGSKAFKVSNSECQSGYTHGVTEAYFREHGTNNLSHNLTLICQDEQNGFYAHQCFHGIGHGLMAFYDYDMPRALKSCDDLQDRPQINKDSCYLGVFMENIVGAIGVDEAKKSTATDYHVSSYLNSDPLFPCNSLDERYKSTCYYFQSSRMLQVLGADFQKIAENCEKIDQSYQSNCFSSTGRDASFSFGSDYAGIERACGYANNETFQLSCIAGASQDKFWDQTEEDKALAMCRGLVAAAYKQRCYSMLAERARDIVAKPNDRKNFCAKYESDYVSACTATL